MKRDRLLKSKDFWMVQIQNDLYGAIQDYMNKNELNRTQLASRLNVTKGYISQVLNGDFDHKISKMVELSLACGYAPFMSFINLDDYIKNDEANRVYDLFAVNRVETVTYSSNNPLKQDTRHPINYSPFLATE